MEREEIIERLTTYKQLLKTSQLGFERHARKAAQSKGYSAELVDFLVTTNFNVARDRGSITAIDYALELLTEGDTPDEGEHFQPGTVLTRAAA